MSSGRAMAAAEARRWLDPYTSLAAREWQVRTRAQLASLRKSGTPVIAARPIDLETAILDYYTRLRRERRAGKGVRDADRVEIDPYRHEIDVEFLDRRTVVDLLAAAQRIEPRLLLGAIAGGERRALARRRDEIGDDVVGPEAERRDVR